MAKKRIFIAVNLPEDIRQKLVEVAEKWRWVPVRWLQSDNWHITIVPPFYVNEKELRLVKKTLERAVKTLRPFDINFDSIILAPPEKRARMIWLIGRQNMKLQDVKEKIEEAFLENKVTPSLKKEERNLLPHVTLARFEEGNLKELEQKTRTLEEAALSFTIAHLDIMESRLKSTGAEYEMLVEVPLGDESLLTAIKNISPL